MKLTLLPDRQDLRARFKAQFLMTWEEFRVVHSQMIANMAEPYQVFDEQRYESSFMWDRMPLSFSVVSFDDALKALREIGGDVLVMGEDDAVGCCNALTYCGEKIHEFIFRTDAQALAECIEFEWYESYRLAELNMYLADALLPEDVYVFNERMDWVIVFTHETSDWDAERYDMMKAAKSRVCIMGTCHKSK